MIWWLILLVLIVPFAAVLIVGAPYLPSHKKTIHLALSLLKLQAGQTLLDLGAGDGAVMVLAARRGLKVVGYELNPLLWLVAKLRLIRYPQAVIYYGNFWKADWPANIDGVYVFLHTRFMARLDSRLSRQRRSQKSTIRVVSLAFDIPGRKAETKREAVWLYEY